MLSCLTVRSSLPDRGVDGRHRTLAGRCSIGGLVMAKAASKTARIKVQETDKGLLITGSVFNCTEARCQCNAQLIESCLNDLLDCAARNGCLEKGLKITDKCLATIAGHNLASGCCSEAFGIGGLVADT